MRLKVTSHSQLRPYDEVGTEFADPQIADLRRIGKSGNPQRSKHRPPVCSDQFGPIEQDQTIDDPFSQSMGRQCATPLDQDRAHPPFAEGTE
jgi:hypothetical protein